MCAAAAVADATGLAHESKTIRPAIADRIVLTKGLLVLLLALFGGARARASGLGFSFLLGRVALGIAIVLLSFTLAHYVVTTGNSPAKLPAKHAQLSAAISAQAAADSTTPQRFCLIRLPRRQGLAGDQNRAGFITVGLKTKAQMSQPHENSC